MSADAADSVMNWTPWISAASAVGGGLIVAVLNHFFTQQRDGKNEKRKIRIQYLIEAYRRLLAAYNRSQIPDGMKLDFETAICDIHLFGNKKQIFILNNFFEKYKNNGPYFDDYYLLLEDLRKNLRVELGVGEASKGLTVFHLVDHDTTNNKRSAT